MQRKNPKYAKLSKQQQHYIDLLERGFWENEKSWDTKLKNRVYHDIEIMVEQPHSSKGIALWEKTHLMHGNADNEDVNWDQLPTVAADVVNNNYSSSDDDEPDFLQNLDLDVANDLPQPPPSVIASHRRTQEEVARQAKETENRISTGNVQKKKPPTENDVYAEAGMNFANLPSSRDQSAAAASHAARRPAPVHSEIPRRPAQPVARQRPARPVFVDVPEEAGGGEQIRTIYCGLNALNKPANAVFGNPLQCLRKGYNIGRGHIRT